MLLLFSFMLVLSPSVVSNSATPWTGALQALLSMEFFRQEYWSKLLFPPPGDLPNPGIKPTSPTSPALQADSLGSLGKPNQPNSDSKSPSCLAYEKGSHLPLCNPQAHAEVQVLMQHQGLTLSSSFIYLTNIY